MTIQQRAFAIFRKCITIAFALCVVAGLFLAATGRFVPGLYVDEKGRVGIGTLKPGSALSVSGGATIGTQSFAETKPAPTSGLIVEGKVGIGNPAPERPLDIGAPGGIFLRQKANTSDQNEIYFQDNGQIRSFDNNHRIIFDRDASHLELRERGDIILSPGSTVGQRTETAKVFDGGMNLRGNLKVDGSISLAVRFQKDDEPEKVYQKTLQRYHMTLTSRPQGEPRSKTIPLDVLISLCGTPDGCTIRMWMTRTQYNSEMLDGFGEFHFAYSESTKRWRAGSQNSFKVGTVGNGQREDAYNLENACWFTDGNVVNGDIYTDTGTGMMLAISNRERDLPFGNQDNSTRTCELTLIP
jgi:hypothetical protein